jgi:hypothetical protein
MQLQDDETTKPEGEQWHVTDGLDLSDLIGPLNEREAAIGQTSPNDYVPFSHSRVLPIKLIKKPLKLVPSRTDDALFKHIPHSYLPEQTSSFTKPRLRPHRAQQEPWTTRSSLNP